MAKRDFAGQPLAAFAAATWADHVRLCAGLVEENQPFGVECALVLLPPGAELGGVRANLPGGTQSLFLKLIPRRLKNRQIELTQVLTWSSRNRPLISTSVRCQR